MGVVNLCMWWWWWWAVATLTQWWWRRRHHSHGIVRNFCIVLPVCVELVLVLVKKLSIHLLSLHAFCSMLFWLLLLLKLFTLHSFAFSQALNRVLPSHSPSHLLCSPFVSFYFIFYRCGVKQFWCDFECASAPQLVPHQSHFANEWDGGRDARVEAGPSMRHRVRILELERDCGCKWTLPSGGGGCSCCWLKKYERGMVVQHEWQV